MKLLSFVFLMILVGSACTPVDDTRAQHEIEDQEIFSKDSIKFQNYIIEVDSLEKLAVKDSMVDHRINTLKSEIKYYRNKWGGRLH